MDNHSKKIETIVTYVFALVCMYFFFPIVWELGVIVSVGFLISCALSLYRGVIFKEPRVIACIAVGYLASAIAFSLLLPAIYEGLLSQSFATAIKLGIVFGIIYYILRKLEKKSR